MTICVHPKASATATEEYPVDQANLHGPGRAVYWHCSNYPSAYGAQSFIEDARIHSSAVGVKEQRAKMCQSRHKDQALMTDEPADCLHS